MSQQWNSSNGGDEELQLQPGAGGEAAPAEQYSRGKYKVNTSTLALVAAFVVALVVLYLLGLQNKPRVASAQEQARAQEMDERIARMLKSKTEREGMNSLFASTNRLIEMLNGYFKSAVEAMDLPGNPFEREASSAESAAKMSPAVQIVTGDPGEAKEMREASEVFAGLKLQMVMMGTTPAALVNDQMVTTGAHLKMWTITDIQPTGVQLTFKNKSVLLAPTAPPTNKR